MIMLNSSINLYYQNVRGLRSKLKNLYNMISLEEYDFIGLSETWLTDSFSNSEVCDERYILYRADRDLERLNLTKGGGVLLAVKNSFNSVVVLKITKNYDAVVVKIREVNLFIAVCYFPPNTPHYHYNDFFEALVNIKSLNINSKLIIVGDFNVDVSFVNGFSLPLDTQWDEFGHFLEMFNMSSVNKVPNILGKTLDLVLTNIEGSYVNRVEANYSLIAEDSYHPPLLVILNLRMASTRNTIKKTTKIQFNFNQMSHDILFSKLKFIDWTPIYNVKDVDIAIDLFYKNIFETFEESVPKMKLYSSHYPKWFTPEIINKLKHKEYHRKRKNNSKFHSEYFKLLRRQLKFDIKKAYNEYILEIQNKIKIDSKHFWDYISNKKKGTGVQSFMEFNGKPIVGGSKIANHFASHFQSVYRTHKANYKVNAAINNLNINVDYLPMFSITSEEVTKAVSELKSKKTAGPDGIPPFIFKEFISVLLDPLLYIYNLSVSNCVFPSAWKIARVIPIFKSGDRLSFSNYRPISILPAVSKIFEKILYIRLSKHVRNNISINQHGFMPGRSTATNLINFVEDLYPIINKGLQVDVIYTDFKKAFDMVDHDILLNKLYNFGISIEYLKLLASYLSDRKQYVRYQGYDSASYEVYSGVPQGSNLGPLLFLCFINDITSVIHESKILLFADDVKFFHVIKVDEDKVSVQRDLTRIAEWSQVNQLPLNVSKCQVMSYSRSKNMIIYDYFVDDIQLKRVYEVKDLGVLFDKGINFDEHVKTLLKSSYSMLGFILRQSAEFNDVHIPLILFNAFIRSKIEYCSLIWYPFKKKYINGIEKLQKRLLKFIFFKLYSFYPEYTIPYDYLMITTGVSHSLGNRVRISWISYLVKLVNNMIDDPDTLNKLPFRYGRICSRRKPDLFYYTMSRTNVGLYTPVYRLTSNYNFLNTFIDIDLSLKHNIIMILIKEFLNVHNTP